MELKIDFVKEAHCIHVGRSIYIGSNVLVLAEINSSIAVVAAEDI